ncbi:MAG TPA: SDR family oxidoreductase [Gemmatimonadales bacterium]|nr:SDR family oxidoreductase [Gemmatimonadales bacterium]
MADEWTALVTGASSGIGYHLARELAKHGHPVIIVAPLQAELDNVAAEISGTYGVNVTPIAEDLEDPEAPGRIFQQLLVADREVDILVNNAGHGQWGRFWEIDVERHLSIIRLNIEAVVRMTALFLPEMIRRNRGRVLNTASIAGFEAGPLLGVYHASKAFVLSLTESLAVETEETEVRVTALCPGATDTDFFAKADMENTRAFQESSLMAPQDVAEAGYKAMMKGDSVIIPGMMNKAMIFTRRVLSESAQAHKNEALYQEVPPSKRRRVRGEKEAAAEQE